MNLLVLAEKALREEDATQKCNITQQLYEESLKQTDECHIAHFHAAVTVDKPGLPASVHLVAPDLVPRRRLGSTVGCAAMLHAVAHIEFNAINLALDVVCRFSTLPAAFYRDWLEVAKEEAYHFTLVTQRMNELGYQYGDFPAHQGLWEMALKTKHDPLARMAMVPRLLEARGLDVTPGLQARLLAAGERQGAALLDIIFRDEVGHVQVGNKWFRALCQQRELDPLITFRQMLPVFDAPKHRGEMNVEARMKAGFTKEDIAALLDYSAS